ncbi:MAG: hypothetical protein ACYC3I_22485, partial [Gemmataceae bacterium]
MVAFGAPVVRADHTFILCGLKTTFNREKRNQKRKCQTRLLQLTGSAKSTTTTTPARGASKGEY